MVWMCYRNAGRQAFKSFDMAAYARKMFGMYAGKEERCKYEGKG